jgi:hypothetical protein
MTLRSPAFLVVCVLVCWTRAGGRADPCSMYIPAAEGAGGTLMPQQNDDVRMVSERVVLEEPAPRATSSGAWEYAPGDWMVRAHYVLENLADRELELTVAFPMHPGEHRYAAESYEDPCLEHDAAPPVNTAGFLVRIDGVEVPHRLEEGEACSEYGSCIGSAYVFTVRFAANARVTLDCEYPQPPSYYVGPEQYPAEVPFILRTGSLWNGPIGAVEIVYRLAAPATDLRLEYVVFADDNSSGDRGPQLAPGQGTVALWSSAASFTYDMSCAAGRTTLTLRAENVEPDGDLVLSVPPLGERIDVVESYGCLTYSGWNAPADDCCEHLTGPTAAERMLAEGRPATPPGAP